MNDEVYDSGNRFDTVTDEYIFVYKSLEKAELVFKRGEEDIAIKFARQMCGKESAVIADSILNEIMKGYTGFENEYKNIIVLNGGMNISRELLQMMYEKMGQGKPRLLFVGNGRVPSGVPGMAIVEIRPEKRCEITRKDGIGIEMLGPNCTGLTRFSLRYKKEGQNNS